MRILFQDMRKLVDRTGKRFGRLVVVRFAGFKCWPSGSRATMWECICDCGKIHITQHLVGNRVAKSCGCLRLDNGKRLFKHGFWNKTHPSYRAYRSWRSMMERCQNARGPNYKRYGGRGITVCDRWRDFRNFWEDMGPTWRLGLTIERIDNNGNYEPSNCTWIPNSKQAGNRTTSRWLTFCGKTQTIAEWARTLGVTWGRIHYRIDTLGWTAERALEDLKNNGHSPAV